MLLRRRLYKQESVIIEGDILTFTAEQANSTVALSKNGSPADISLQYSTNGGSTWNDYTIGDTITLVNIGDNVKFRGENSSFSSSTSNYYKFQMTGGIVASGDVTSLLNGVGGDVDLTNKNYCFHNLFSKCTALIKAPELPSTTLEQYCYYAIFNSCTSLTVAPNLPATDLAVSCYLNMFKKCTALTTAPELPATELQYLCYVAMFNGCTNLNYIKAMFTTTPSSSYTYAWVSGVAATGTFVKNSAAQWDLSSVDGIPTGWTVETASE